MNNYTAEQLKIINVSKKAVAGQDYIQITGNGIGTQYRGRRDGTLEFITDNFTTKAQEAVGKALTNTGSADSEYIPGTEEEEAEIKVEVNQMQLGDVLAFAAAN